jgi:hypothetical protein
MAGMPEMGQWVRGIIDFNTASLIRDAEFFPENGSKFSGVLFRLAYLARVSSQALRATFRQVQPPKNTDSPGAACSPRLARSEAARTQINVNHHKARRGAGPRSAARKARVSRNAIKLAPRSLKPDGPDPSDSDFRQLHSKTDSVSSTLGVFRGRRFPQRLHTIASAPAPMLAKCTFNSA